MCKCASAVVVIARASFVCVDNDDDKWHHSNLYSLCICVQVFCVCIIKEKFFAKHPKHISYTRV